MKILAALLSALALPNQGSGARALIRLVVVLVATVTIFTAGFVVLMAREGQDHSWWSGVYWTVVTMSTLGFGDIVFTTDIGRLYSVLVLITGAVLILVLLPFTFIQLVYLPWRAAAREAQAPRSLPHDLRGHLLLTGRLAVEEALIRRAITAGMPYAIIVSDVEHAVELHEAGYRVMVGRHDDPETYRAARVDQAAMVFTARSDQANANIAFTIREVSERVLIVSTANSPDSVDVLELAGADHVIRLGEILGRTFARSILAPTARCSEISTFADLVIAEASAASTPLVGHTLAELDLRRRFGVSVVGIWDRGQLQPAGPDQRIGDRSILLLAGRREQLAAYDEAYAPGEAQEGESTMEPVVIIGGGRVGRATARTLVDAGLEVRIVERDADRIRNSARYVHGDAADRRVLETAGIDRAPAVVITTHDDDTNIFLTLYCRKLRPDVEILGRVAIDTNLSTMHRAGADFVMSYASTGAAEAWNAMFEDSTLLLAEGLVVFRVPMPSRLAGRRLIDTAIPDETGANVIAILRNGTCVTDLDLDEPLPDDAHLVLIGDDRAEERFLARYVAERSRRRWGQALTRHRKPQLPDRERAGLRAGVSVGGLGERTREPTTGEDA